MRRNDKRDGRGSFTGHKSFRQDFNRGPREMHKAVCSKCGKDCEVPFKPSNDEEGNPRPVYCKDCYVRPQRRY